MKKLVLASVAAFTIVVALSGCSTVTTFLHSLPTWSPTPVPPVTAAQSPSSDTAAAPAPAPADAPAPSPAPAAALPSPAGWTISNTGYGPVHIGSDAGAALVGAGFILRAAAPSQCVDLYDYASGNIKATGQQDYAVTVGEVAGRVRYVYVNAEFNDHLVKQDDAPHSDTGMTFGSTVADLRAAYPGITKTADTWSPVLGGYREFVTSQNGLYLHFYTTGGTTDSTDYLDGIRIDDTAGEQTVC